MYLLAENPRTQAKAAIKRATASAQANIRRLDKDMAAQLTTLYQSAVDDIRAYLVARAGDDTTLRLEVMRDLLGQAEQRLATLEATRNGLLNEGLTQAVKHGVEPFATTIGINTTQIADDALNFVTHFIAEDGLQLSDRIWAIDNGAREAVANAIQRSIIQGHSASQAAQDFIRRGNPVPKAIADKIAGANATAIGKQIAGGVLNSPDGAYANALRLFRTEINRAHGEAYQASAFEHPDVIGTKFLLSPNHPRVDICDMHAKVNRHGLGPGVYPKGKNPWPAHPNTISFVVAVFDDEVTDEDRQGKQDRIEWLKAQPSGDQISVLGHRKAWALNAGHLKENSINTPWQSLKKRLERQGIEIPTTKEQTSATA